MLTVGQSNNVSFKVNVMGTSSEPKVRVILASSPELSFTAHKDGEKWVVPMNVPASFEPGSYEMRVEVVLNNRLFTPIQKKIDVLPSAQNARDDIQAALPDLQAAFAGIDAMPEAPHVVQAEPKAKSDSSMFSTIVNADPVHRPAPVPKKPAPVQPKIQAKMPEIKQKTQEDKKPAGLGLLEEFSKRAPKKRFEVKSDMPAPSGKPAAPIRVKISEINAQTMKRTSRSVLAETPVLPKAKKASIISLVKEDIIYQ